MYRHCTRCEMDVPDVLWREHRRQHRLADPDRRNGRGASAAQKREVKARQGHRCIRCGLVTASLEVHHVNGNWRDNRRENLVAACSDCHRLLDAEVRRRMAAR